MPEDQPAFSPDEPLPPGWIGTRLLGGEWSYRFDPEAAAELEAIFGTDHGVCEVDY